MVLIFFSNSSSRQDYSSNLLPCLADFERADFDRLFEAIVDFLSMLLFLCYFAVYLGRDFCIGVKI